MADLTIPDVPEETHAAIRARAAAEGRSVAQELRALVERTYGAAVPLSPEALRARLDALAMSRDPDASVDRFLAERRREWGEEG